MPALQPSPAEFETLVDRNAKLQCGMSKADFIEMVRVGMNMDMDMGMDMDMNTCPDPHEPPDHRLIQRRRAYGNRFLAWSQRGAGRQDDNARRETMMS